MEHINRWKRGELNLLLMLVFCLFSLIPSLVFANSQKPLEDNVSVPDIVGQFNGIKNQGEWIGAYRHPTTGGVGETFGEKQHYQGIVRAPFHKGGKNNVLYVSRSGEVDDDGNNEPPYLGTVRLNSVSANPSTSTAIHGERMGSNLLQKGEETGSSAPLDPNDQSG